MAGYMELFKLAAKLVLDTTDFDSGINDAKKSLQDTGKGFESWITKLSSGLNVVSKVSSGLVGTTKGVASAGMSLVDTAASMKVLREATTDTFGALEKDAEKAFARVGEINNVATLRLQQSGLAFYRQFLSTGQDSATALTSMETALGVAADAAAAYDISIEDASERMRSFLRGNVEAGEAIGLFVTALDRERIGLELFGQKNWAKLEEHERQAVLMARIMEIYSQNNVFGQGAREAKSWTNVVGNLTSAWEKASSIMGAGIMEKLSPALESLTGWINENDEIFESLGETMGHIATAMVDAFKSLLTFISEHEDDILGFINSLNALFSGEMTWQQLLFGGRTLSNQPRPKASEDEQRAAAMAWLTGEGSYTAAEAAFGKGDAVLGKLLTKFNDGGAENVTAEVAAQWIDEAFASLQSDLNAENFTANVSIDAVMGKGWDLLVSGANWLGRSLFGDRPGENEGAKFNAKGLDYVPYDNYVTRLHRGEKILSRVEAENWRVSARAAGNSVDPSAIAEAVRAALSGVTVSMDGHDVGALITPYVSREQARASRRAR